MPPMLVRFPQDSDDFTGFRIQSAVKVEDNGDVVFDAVAVDKNRIPNRRGFVFDWASENDVELDSFMKNPVMFYVHDSSMIPIGQWEKVRVTNKQVIVRGRIPNMAEDPDMAAYDAAYIAPIRGAVRRGLLRMVSIGFYIVASEDVTLKGDVRATKITKFEIVEISICPVGAHSTALISQTQAIQPIDMKDLLKKMGPGKWVSEVGSGNDGRKLHRLSITDAEVVDRTYAYCPACDQMFQSGEWGYDGQDVPHCRICGGEIVYDLTEEEANGKVRESQGAGSWKAIPYSRHGKCDLSSAETWSGPDEVKKATPDQLAFMCALEDPDHKDSKSGFKLPHHEANGEHPKLNWKGCASGLAVLLGARGGVKGLSTAEKKEVYAHFRQHYEDLNKECPELQDYTADQLQALHDAGKICIPGAVQQQQQQSADLTKLTGQCETLRNRVSQLEQENATLRTQMADMEKRATSAEEKLKAVPATELDLSPELLETFRQKIASIFNDSPVLRTMMRAKAEETLAQFRKGLI